MRTGIILLLLAFLAGGAVGYVVGIQGSAVEPADSPVPGPSAPEPSARKPNASAPVVGGSGGGAAIESLIRSTPAPATRSGAGRIDGTVVDEAGQPLAGVVVRATARRARTRYSRPAPVDGSAPRVTSLEEEARWFLEQEVERRTRRHEVVTGADGQFTFTGLANLEHHVRAYRRGMSFRNAGSRNWIAPGATIELVGQLQGLVTVDVIGPDGLPMEEAEVAYRDRDRASSRSWRRDRPTIALAFGEWRVNATGGRDEEYASKETTIRLTRDEPEAEVTFVLEPRPGIRGRVVFLPDEPGARIEVRADPEDRTDEEENFRSRGRRSVTASAGDGGGFFIKDLEPGRYVVRLIGYPDDVGSTTVTVGDGPAEVELVVPPPSPDTSVLVRATGPDGKEVPDLNLSEHLTHSRGSTSGGGRSIRLGDGTTHRFYFSKSVTEMRKGGAGKVERHIVARSSLFGTQAVPVPPDTSQVEVVFMAPANLTVTVDNWGDTGRESKLRLALIPGVEVRRGLRGGPIGKGGTLTFGPIRPGEYTVSLTHPIGHHEQMVVESMVVNLTAGDNRANLSIPEFYRLTAVIEGAEGASFKLEAGDGSWDTFPDSTEDGEISWEVPPGEYVIAPWGSDLGPDRRVRVPSETRVVFRKIEPDCMRVRITGAGLLPDAGFRDGDYVIGVNGKDFTDRRHMKALMTLASLAETVTFKVLRGGKTLEIKVSGPLVGGDRKEMGGTFKRAARTR